RAVARRRGLGWWQVSAFAAATELAGLVEADEGTGSAPAGDGGAHLVQVTSRDVEGYRGETERAVADLRDLTRQGWRLVLVTEGPGPARRMVEQLLDADVPARLVAAVEPAGADARAGEDPDLRSEEHTSELQSRFDLVCRLL